MIGRHATFSNASQQGMVSAKGVAPASSRGGAAVRGTKHQLKQSLSPACSPWMGAQSPALCGAHIQRPSNTQTSARQSSTISAMATSEKMTVAITGATGLVGCRLASKLASQGHTVRALTRNPGSARSKLPFPGVEVYGPADWAKAIQGATGVVNLAGEPIATRWTPEIKEQVKASRVRTTKTIVDYIAATPEEQRPNVLVSGSAVGYYGISQNASFSEDSPPGSDYLAEVCREWEAAAKEAEGKGTRTVILRIGIVLANDGGALGKMLPVFQIFAGGPLGSGRQWMSWVHRDDLVELIVESLKNPAYSGIYNATAPKPVRMSELCSSLGNILGRPSWLPVPDFALQALLGEGATVVLEGQRVLPARTQSTGFQFKYSEVNSALRNIMSR